MISLLKKIFYKNRSYKESITIFEEQTRVDYDSSIAKSFKVLSLTQSKLQDLTPFESFINLEMLNFSSNMIDDITSLKNLNNLKIIDLRFNNIEEIPPWVFKFEDKVYWKREDYRQEGIFFEGNPFPQELVDKIKNNSKKIPQISIAIEYISTPIKIENKKEDIIEVEKLQPLLTQKITIIYPNFNNSNFLLDFTQNSKYIRDKSSGIRLNITLFEYDKMDTIINREHYLSQPLQYIVVILKDYKCCYHPKLLESISKEHPNSKIFLIIENKNDNLSSKIDFFNSYKKSLNIIETFHSFDEISNHKIIERIYQRMKATKEPNSLWRLDWIELKNEIETKEKRLTYIEYLELAKRYNIDKELSMQIFKQLEIVGSIKYK